MSRLTDRQLEQRDHASDKIRDAIERYNAEVRAHRVAAEAAHGTLTKAWEVLNRAMISLRVTAHSIGDDLEGPLRKTWRGFDAEPPPFPSVLVVAEIASDAALGGFEDLPTSTDDDSESDDDEE